MNNIDMLFLSLYGFAIRGETGKKLLEAIPKGMDYSAYKRLFAVAESHCVFPMIFDTVYSVLEENEKENPYIQRKKRRAERLTCKQAQMTACFLDLYRFLINKNLNPITIKGIISRSLYPQPEQRLSSDEDLLIPENQFSDYHKALTEYGLKIALDGVDTNKEHEIPYCNGDIYIELHKKPFSSESKTFGKLNSFFEDVEERKITKIVYGVPVSTMDYTDHLFYQICHAYKHFFNCGIGIRIVSDIVFYSMTYADRIDWGLVIDRCNRIQAYDFTSALYRIGEKYLFQDKYPGTLKRIWNSPDLDEMPLLQDILAGGLYGTSNDNRLHSANLTLYAAEEAETGIHSSAVLRALFPSFSSMKRRYSYLNSFPYLLPFAWAQRILNYRRNNKQEINFQNKVSETVRIGNERIALMRRYRVLNNNKETSLLRKIYKISYSSFLAPVFSPIYHLISVIEYNMLNLIWYIKGDRRPSKEDKELVRNKVTFIVKSFERQHMVKGLCRNLTYMYPGTRIIVADDSHDPLSLEFPETKVIHLPFNSGLSAGLAAALNEVETPYVMRLDDDELLTLRSKVHRELRFLQEHSELDLIGFGYTTAIRLHSPEFYFKEYYRNSMKNALKPLKINHMTRIDDNHIVLGKVANIYLGRTEKIREVGFDPNIKVIDHNEFFWRAAGIITCAIASDTVVFHRHNPYDRKYRSYRSDYQSDLEYIRKKQNILKKEAKNNEQKAQ